jgi:hypothetical protein
VRGSNWDDSKDYVHENTTHVHYDNDTEIKILERIGGGEPPCLLTVLESHNGRVAAP